MPASKDLFRWLSSLSFPKARASAVASPENDRGANDEVVLLFTSAPSGRPQYTLDFLTCLASPDGHRVTFSYKREWLADAVYAGKLIGKRALVVFSEENKEDGDMTFFPLRWAEIKSFEPRQIIAEDKAQPDTRLAITFKLGRFVYSDPKTAAAKVGEATTRWRALKVRPYRREIETRDSRWVILDKFDEDVQATDAQTAWIAHAGELAKCTSLKQALIFRVSRPEYLGWHRQREFVTIGRNRLLDEAYKLRAGKQYKLVVGFFHSNAVEAANPKDLVRADVSSEKVKMTAPISAALGQETVATVFFGAAALSAAEVATVTVQGPAEMPDAPSPTVAFIVRFRPGWPAIILGTLLISVGVLLNGLTADDWTRLTLRLSAGWVLALKFVGAASAGVGALIAFRRGPSGG